MDREKALERLKELLITCDVGIKEHPQDKELFSLDKKAIQFAIMCIENNKEVVDYTTDKIKKSFEYDCGIAGQCTDRLFTETVIEFQLIQQKLNKGVENDNNN